MTMEARLGAAAPEEEVMCQTDSDGPQEDAAPPTRAAKWWRTRPTVEPLVLLFMFSYVVTHSVVNGLFLERVCRSSDTSVCTNEDRAYSSTLTTWKTIIEAIVPAAVSLFIGSWSDKFGRRPIFIWSFAGNAIAYGVFSGLAAIPDLAPEWLLMPSVAATFSGGMINLMAVANVYIADVSPAGHKELRLGILDAAQYSAMMLGSGLSTPLFLGLSYHGVFALAAGLMLLCLLYSIFLLPETMAPYTPPEDASCGCCKGIFRPQLVRDALKTSLMKRPHHGRSTILIVIVVVVTGVLISQGEGVASYQFLNAKFQWTVEQSLLYGFFTNGTTAVGTMVGVLVFIRWLKLADGWIALITFSCKIAAAIIYSISPESWYMFLGGAVACFGALIWVLVRAMLTRLVAKDEIGQVFALAVTIESVTPLVGTPMYNAVFNASINTFPGAFYLLSAGIMVIDLLLLLFAIFLNRGAKREQQRQLDHTDSKTSAPE
ncbi:proton-coupled folate transporter-like [Schistocerca gregaria]|uniref:proton-coupled folate transporter-like n=1 Tax=Schistocerca gregaria TaxID=7010 RepID=UPI00211F2A33|nr:proton-coupled folate transporter-like [Schistocerca gregaria]